MLGTGKIFRAIVLGALLALGTTQSAHAVLRINEMMINAPGGGDNGFEFIEISGDPSQSVSGVWLVVIDNEGTDIGVVNHAVDLTSAGTVGTNGLLLIRDSASPLSPAPNGATVLVVNDFMPDLDNDHHAYLLVTGFTGSVATDLDTNDNATLESTPWIGLLDAIAIVNDTTEPDIASALGGTLISGAGVFTPDVIFRNPNNPSQIIGCDALGTNPGPYTIDPTNITDPAFTTVPLTPGNVNNTGNIGKALAFNEIFINAPGADNGQEFIELRGNDGETVDNVTILAVDNDGAAIGTILNAVNISSSITVGENGLLLVRDSATVLSPVPHVETRIRVTDFVPDLDDNSITFLLVTGFSGSVGNDLDTNDDGAVDSTPWASLLDALYIADPSGEPSIADPLGGVSTVVQAFTPDVVIVAQLGGTLIYGDVLGTNPGPYTLDLVQVFPTDFMDEQLTPGSANPSGLSALPLNKVEFFEER